MKHEIEKAIRETLVISNPESIKYAVEKISNLLSKQPSEVGDEEDDVNFHARANTLTPPDAEKEAVMFAEWIRNNYTQRYDGKYFHNNWSGDKETLVIYTTQELFNLYKQGGK